MSLYFFNSDKILAVKIVKNLENCENLGLEEWDIEKMGGMGGWNDGMMGGWNDGMMGGWNEVFISLTTH
jgi:hypothetical protein